MSVSVSARAHAHLCVHVLEYVNTQSKQIPKTKKTPPPTPGNAAHSRAAPQITDIHLISSGLKSTERRRKQGERGGGDREKAFLQHSKITSIFLLRSPTHFSPSLPTLPFLPSFLVRVPVFQAKNLEAAIDLHLRVGEGEGWGEEGRGGEGVRRGMQMAGVENGGRGEEKE